MAGAGAAAGGGGGAAEAPGGGPGAGGGALEELKGRVAAALEAGGELGALRAEVRAKVFLAVERGDRAAGGGGLAGGAGGGGPAARLEGLLAAEEGRGALALVEEFLEWAGLRYTAEVLAPESGGAAGGAGGRGPGGRAALAERLGLDPGARGRPLLAELLRSKGGAAAAAPRPPPARAGVPEPESPPPLAARAGAPPAPSPEPADVSEELEEDLSSEDGEEGTYLRGGGLLLRDPLELEAELTPEPEPEPASPSMPKPSSPPRPVGTHSPPRASFARKEPAAPAPAPAARPQGTAAPAPLPRAGGPLAPLAPLGALTPLGPGALAPLSGPSRALVGGGLAPLGPVKRLPKLGGGGGPPGRPPTVGTPARGAPSEPEAEPEPEPASDADLSQLSVSAAELGESLEIEAAGLPEEGSYTFSGASGLGRDFSVGNMSLDMQHSGLSASDRSGDLEGMYAETDLVESVERI